MNRCLPLLLAATAWAATAVAPARAAEWTSWRGPHDNGFVEAKGLPEKFSLKADDPDSNLLWRAPYGGRSTPIVMNGRVYLINKAGGGEGDTEEERLHIQERVMCVDADTGKLVWEHRFNVWHTDIVAVRLGWGNVVGDPETGNVYAAGTQGLLFCFDGKDGKVLWQHSLTEEYGRVSGYGGRVTSPIVDGDLVIIGMLNSSWGEQAVGENRFVAIDKRTGKVVWWGHTGLRPKDTYYSTPVVAEIGGQRLLVSGGGDGAVHAFKVRTGEHVWSYVFGTGAVNCSPVVDGDLVYIGQGEDNAAGGAQGSVICVNGAEVQDGKPKLVWLHDGLKAKFTSPIFHEGRLYITDELATLYCLDGKTGATQWTHTYGKNSKGSPVLADGKIYVPDVNSRFVILKPGEKDCETLHSQFFRKRAGGPDVEINGSPAVAHDRVYFMTSNELICLGKKGAARPDGASAATHKDVMGSGAPAHLQVFPADITLHPGEKVELKALAFDAKGQPLGEAEVEWSLAGALPPVVPGAPPVKPAAGTPTPQPPPALQGTLSDKQGKATTVTAAKEKAPPAQFGRVVAKHGGLTAYTRVRVAPVLPYKPNFANIPEKRTPGGWVNTQGKFEMVTLKEDGKEPRHVLRKTTANPSPLVARANGYMGTPDLTDYTVQADVQGTKSGADLPDVGVVANRYTLMLAGNTQQLRLVSWDAIPRVDKTIAFGWKPGAWYRMKLTAAVSADGKKATVRGKVWPRDEAEPSDWTVEFVDPVPNKEGAPALYGYVVADEGKPGTSSFKAGTNIYYENVSVVPNGAK
jgi:outer membrane protein assembly factor BamB